MALNKSLDVVQSEENLTPLSPRSQAEEEIDILTENLRSMELGQDKFELNDSDEISFEEGEIQEHLDPICLHDPGLQELITLLVDWIHGQLTLDRVQLNNIETDYRDGQLQSKTKLIFAGEILNTLRPSVILPRALKVNILKIKRVEKRLQHEKRVVNILGNHFQPGARDAFDTLIENAPPQKVTMVKNVLKKFVNSYLTPIGFEVETLEEFQDGARFCALIGCLQKFFIPFYAYIQKPETFEERLKNVEFAITLLEDGGFAKPVNRAAEIARGDIKSILRIIYGLFVKYKTD